MAASKATPALLTAILAASLATVGGDTRHGYGSAGGGAAYNTGRNIGAAINGAISGKIQGVAGFIDGLVSGPAPAAHPHTAPQYVAQPSPCRANSCYGGGHSASVSCRSHGSCGCSGSCNSVSAPAAVQQSSHSSSHSSGHSPAAYPNCQCDYLFNSAGQGNCNEAGARSHTSDRWCYVAEDVGGKWVEAQWACPDAVKSDVHSGRFWSHVACDTPRHGHG